MQAEMQHWINSFVSAIIQTLYQLIAFMLQKFSVQFSKGVEVVFICVLSFDLNILTYVYLELFNLYAVW